MNCLIIEDEKKSADICELLINSTGIAEVTDIILEANFALEKIKETKPDIVFLDIDMPYKNGFELLSEINELKLNTKVVFTSAYDKYILEAFRNGAFDYLTKPIDRLELKNSLTRYQKTNKKNNKSDIISDSLEMLKIPIRTGYIFVRINEILYIEADGNYSKIHLINENHISTMNIGKYDENLREKNFLRISKSCLINPFFLTKFNKKEKTCTLKINSDKFELKISRRKINLLDNIY